MALFEVNDLVEFDGTIIEPGDLVARPLVVRCRVRMVCQGHCHVAVMHKGAVVAEWAMRNEALRKTRPGS